MSTGVAITTACWLIVTFLTRPADDKTLRSFYSLVRPGGIGWNKVLSKAQQDGEPITQTATAGDLPRGILCMVAGCFAVYSAVFAAGYYMYGQIIPAVICTAVVVVAVTILVSVWGKLEMK